MKLKGQNLRLKFNGKYFAAAKSCSVHISKQTEDSSTKDDTGDWSAQEIVGKGWDASTSALFTINDVSEDLTGNSGADILATVATSDEPVDVEFLVTTGEKNRVENNQIPSLHYYGKAIINDFTLNANNRENASYDVQLQGVGQLTTTPPSSNNVENNS